MCVIKNSEYNRGITPSSSTTMCSSSETFPEELKRMFRKHTVNQGISSSDVPDDKNNYQIPLKSEYSKPASNGISTENDVSEKSRLPKRDGMDCVVEDNLAHSGQNKHVSITAKNKVLRKCHACPHCNYTTPSTSHLKNHIVVHEEIRPYKCQLCDYTASQAVTLRRHIDAVHYGKKPYKCEHCDYRASDMSNLRKHEAAIHEGKKLHPCPYCDYRTAQSSNVQLHVRAVHEKIKPYGCHICDYRSSQNVHLRRHIKAVHSGKVNTAVTKVSSMK